MTDVVDAQQSKRTDKVWLAGGLEAYSKRMGRRQTESPSSESKNVKRAVRREGRNIGNEERGIERDRRRGEEEEADAMTRKEGVVDLISNTPNRTLT